MRSWLCKVRIWYDRRFVGVNKLGNNVSCRSWRSPPPDISSKLDSFSVHLSLFVPYKSISYTVLHPSASFQVRSNVSSVSRLRRSLMDGFNRIITALRFDHHSHAWQNSIGSWDASASRTEDAAMTRLQFLLFCVHDEVRGDSFGRCLAWSEAIDRKVQE